MSKKIRIATFIAIAAVTAVITAFGPMANVALAGTGW